MSSLRNLFRLLGFLLATTLLAACGGGGSDPAPAPPPPPGGGTNNPPSGGGAGGPSAAYLFYTSLASGDLRAVDPATPASPLTVVAGWDISVGQGVNPVSVRTIKAGTYNGAAQTLTGLHVHALVYASIDGKLYRVSALKGGSLPPVQVSSESGTRTLCESRQLGIGEDFSDPDNSQYIYLLPGGDGQCNTDDDVWKMVRLRMSASDAPVAAKPPVIAIKSKSTGAIAGWLVHEAGALQRCDANFANCNVVMASVSRTPMALNHQGIDRYVMEINNRIFVYNGTANTLSPRVFTIPDAGLAGMASIFGINADDTAVYFAADKSVYRFPADGSAAATPLITEAVDIGVMTLTTNKVVYQVGNEIKAVAKTGGTPITLAAATGSDVLEPGLFYGMGTSSGNYVYYNIINIDATTTTININRVAAVVVDENGGNRSSTPNAAWIGGTFPHTISLNASSNASAGKVIRAEGGTSNGFGGATLKSFNAATAVEVATLGTLPAADNWSSLLCFGIFNGDNALCTASVQPSVVLMPMSDIFFINTATANSLTRVTNTPDKSEMNLFY